MSKITVQRFNIYANMCDGKGHVKVTEKPILSRSVQPQLAALVAKGASKPMAVNA